MEKIAARMFRMDEQTWRRHANPWSVWTRALTLLPLTLAIWSRVWIGGWAIVIVVLIGLWLWLNPRLFDEPRSTDNWGSKATFGERILLQRQSIDIPVHHIRAITLMKVIAFAGVFPYAIGLWQLDLELTIIGLLLIYTGKMWFLDRMVWLYEDMRHTKTEFESWLYRDRN
jgi:hypothetical protein